MDEEPKFKAEGLMASDIDADELAAALMHIARGIHKFKRELVKTWMSPEFQQFLRGLKRWDREMKRRGVFPREIKRRPISHKRATIYRRKMARLA